MLFVRQTETLTSSVSSAIRIVDCKSVFGFVTKPGASAGSDKPCAVDFAIIRGCQRQVSVALRWIDVTDAEKRAGDEQLARTFLKSHGRLSKEVDGAASQESKTSELPIWGSDRQLFSQEGKRKNDPASRSNHRQRSSGDSVGGGRRSAQDHSRSGGRDYVKWSAAEPAWSCGMTSRASEETWSSAPVPT